MKKEILIKAKRFVSIFTDETETIVITSDGTVKISRSKGKSVKTFTKWDHTNPALVAKCKEELQKQGYSLLV